MYTHCFLKHFLLRKKARWARKDEVECSDVAPNLSLYLQLWCSLLSLALCALVGNKQDDENTLHKPHFCDRYIWPRCHSVSCSVTASHCFVLVTHAALAHRVAQRCFGGTEDTRRPAQDFLGLQPPLYLVTLLRK